MRAEALVLSVSLAGTAMLLLAGELAEPRRTYEGGGLITCEHLYDEPGPGCVNGATGINYAYRPRCQMVWFAAPYFPSLRCQ